MLNYKKTYEPFTVDGATLEGSRAWLKATTKADDRIIDQVIAETMDLVAGGEKFDGPCICGCPGGRAHTKIEHFMRKSVESVAAEVEKTLVDRIELKQKALLESQLKKLSDFDKQMNKLMNGTLWNKFKKFIGMNYEGWINEDKKDGA